MNDYKIAPGRFYVYSTWLLLSLLCNIYGLKAQNHLINTTHYRIDEGLSDRNVQTIYKDQRGFVWIGTKYGLNRFDGIDFKWYTKENDGLQSNEVNHILEDQAGRLWLIYTGSSFNKPIRSIDIYDPLTDAIQSFADIFGNQSDFEPTEIVSFA
ncbi:MAG: two-component regulator propeller domain-containing protein, partial [Bacteroidota bacterium]